MYTELQRHLIDLAVAAGKKYAHPETGYVTISEGESQGFVPLYENFLYVLALLRSRKQENVLEAKRLLGQLLYFQQTNESVAHIGSFPIYLHEYPKCKDALQAVHILTLLYWIEKEFGHVLGIKTLNAVIKSLTDYCLTIDTAPFAYWAKVKVAAVLRAYGHAVDVVGLPKEFLPDPVSIAHLISSFQLAPDLMDWNPFWQMVAVTWQDDSCRFAGPSFRVFQDGYQQQVTAYEYMMAGYVGKIAPVADCIQFAALSGAYAGVYVPPASAVAFNSRCEITNSTGNYNYSLFYAGNTSVSVIAGGTTNQQVPGFSPLYILTKTHSLTLDVPKGVVEAFHRENETLFLDVVFDERAFVEERENCVLSLWFDDQKECSLTISENKATCFDLAEPIVVTLSDVSIAIGFIPLEGNAQFVGHVSRLNRRAQRQGKNRQAAYDTHLFLRSIRGGLPCKMRLSFRILSP